MEEIAKKKENCFIKYIGWIKQIFYIFCWILVFIFTGTIKKGEDINDHFGFFMFCIIAWSFMITFYSVSFVYLCKSKTYILLSNMNINNSINNIMENLFKEKPEVNIKCNCYHMETKAITTYNGSGTQTTFMTIPVSTYTETQKLNIFSYLDISGIFRLKEANKNLIILELGKEINFNDEMTLYDAEKIKNELYSKNRFKDICISVTIERIVPSLKNYYLINLNGQDYPLLKKWIYITCFILTFDQLYTLYLESLCSYQFFVIRKIISSRNNVLENEKYSKFTTGYTINNNNFVAERKSIGGISTDIEPELPTEEEIEKAKIYNKYIPEYKFNETGDIININENPLDNILEIKEENKKNEINKQNNNNTNNNNLSNTINQPLINNDTELSSSK